IDLSWDSVSGAAGYKLYFATSDGVTSGTGTEIDVGNVTAHTHTERANGQTYYYVIVAYDGGSGESADSGQVSATPLAAPSISVAADTSGEIDISWSTITGAAGYDLYWAESSGVTSSSGTKIADVSSPFTHTPRTNGTRYYYVLQAKNAG